MEMDIWIIFSLPKYYQQLGALACNNILSQKSKCVYYFSRFVTFYNLFHGDISCITT